MQSIDHLTEVQPYKYICMGIIFTNSILIDDDINSNDVYLNEHPPQSYYKCICMNVISHSNKNKDTCILSW